MCKKKPLLVRPFNYYIWPSQLITLQHSMQNMDFLMITNMVIIQCTLITKKCMIYHFNHRVTADAKVYRTWLYVKCAKIYDHFCTRSPGPQLESMVSILFWSNIKLATLLKWTSKLKLRTVKCHELHEVREGSQSVHFNFSQTFLV